MWLTWALGLAVALFGALVAAWMVLNALGVIFGLMLMAIWVLWDDPQERIEFMLVLGLLGAAAGWGWAAFWYTRNVDTAVSVTVIAFGLGWYLLERRRRH